MQIFSAKSIGIYSLVIAGSIAFFQLVTGYGEANIKAPIAIVGNYLINTQKLPGCLDRQKLALNLLQSGVYINASLVNSQPKITTSLDSYPTLSGKLKDRQFNLSGQLPTIICTQRSNVRITGSVQGDRNRKLQGKIWLTGKKGESLSADRSIEFTATLQPIDRQILE
jgi:hypothetical protein